MKRIHENYYYLEKNKLKENLSQIKGTNSSWEPSKNIIETEKAIYMADNQIRSEILSADRFDRLFVQKIVEDTIHKYEIDLPDILGYIEHDYEQIMMPKYYNKEHVLIFQQVLTNLLNQIKNFYPVFTYSTGISYSAWRLLMDQISLYIERVEINHVFSETAYMIDRYLDDNVAQILYTCVGPSLSLEQQYQSLRKINAILREIIDLKEELLMDGRSFKITNVVYWYIIENIEKNGF